MTTGHPTFSSTGTDQTFQPVTTNTGDGTVAGSVIPHSKLQTSAGVVGSAGGEVALPVADAPVAAGVGAITDTAYNGTGSASLIAAAKGLFTKLGAVVLGAGANVIGAVTQSGTWTVNQGGTWALSAGAAVIGAVTQSGTWAVNQAGTWSLGASAAVIGAVTQSGAWTVTQSGNWVLSAGAAIIGSVTQSGTWTVNQGGTWTIGAGAAVIGAVTQSGSWVLAAGTALIGKVSLQTAGADVAVGNPLPVSATFSDSSTPVTGAVMPSGGTGQQGWLSYIASMFASSQQTTAVGTPASQSLMVGGIYNSIAPAPATGQGVGAQMDAAANINVTSRAPDGRAAKYASVVAAASTNLLAVKASPGYLLGYRFSNNAAYAVFVKLYDKATTPTLASDTPFDTITVPAGAQINVNFPHGLAMVNGLSMAVTKLVAKTDTTVLVANDAIGVVLYN